MFKLKQTNQTTCCIPCMQDNLSFQFQKPIGLICRLHAVCSEFLLSAPWAKNPHVSLPLQTCENSSKGTPLPSGQLSTIFQTTMILYFLRRPAPPPAKKKHMRKVKYFSRQHIFGSFVMLAKYHRYWSCIFAQLCPPTPRKKCEKCRKFVALHPRWVDDASQPGPQSLDFLESWWFPRDPQHQGHIAKCLHFRTSKPLSIQHIEQRQLKHHSFNACWCDLPVPSIALDILDGFFYLHFGCLWQGHLSGNLGPQYLPNKTASIISFRIVTPRKTSMEYLMQMFQIREGGSFFWVCAQTCPTWERGGCMQLQAMKIHKDSCTISRVNKTEIRNNHYIQTTLKESYVPHLLKQLTNFSLMLFICCWWLLFSC